MFEKTLLYKSINNSVRNIEVIKEPIQICYENQNLNFV